MPYRHLSPNHRIALFSIALIAVLAACGDDDQHLNQSPDENSHNTDAGNDDQPNPDEVLQAAIEDFLTENFADQPSNPCFAAARITADEIARAVGCADSENSRDIDFDSRFQIGSITKTMLGIVTRGYLADNEMEVTTPVEELLPDGMEVPRNQGEEILVGHLLTHTSGLPRFPTAVISLGEEDNPFAHVSASDILEGLDHPSLEFVTPVGTWNYSNYGTMLLTVALVEHSGLDFDELLAEYVLDPAGMDDSGLRKPTVQGHDEDGEPAPTWDLQTNVAGVGGLRSSLNDMIAYVQLNQNRGDEPPPNWVQEAQRSIAHWEDSPFEMGSLWFIFEDDDPQLQALQHSGLTGSFATSIFIEKEGDRATIVLADTGGIDAGIDDLVDQFCLDSFADLF